MLRTRHYLLWDGEIQVFNVCLIPHTFLPPPVQLRWKTSLIKEISVSVLSHRFTFVYKLNFMLIIFECSLPIHPPGGAQQASGGEDE